MESNFQTSFIPKKPLTQTGGLKPVHTTNFFSLIATVVFITTVIISLLIFGYSYYLNSSITKMKATLQTDLSQFQPSMIDEFSRLDSRIKSTNSLLGQHLALSSFFDFLGQNTVQTIRFKNFSYTSNSTGLVISMDGQAENYSDIALESSQLLQPQNQQYLSNPLFSNLSLDDKGDVGFSFSATLNPSVFLYKNTISALPSVMVSTSTIEETPAAIVSTSTDASSTAASSTSQ